ncbi:MAG: glycosyltransferase [Clostridia bacterium]|nr:glycosyltransferase [Clostridia bacterium]
MKKVGLLISTLNSGGAERVVAHLSHILSQRYDVHVILFEDTYLEYECGGTLHSLDVPAREGAPAPVKVQILLRRVAALRRLIRREKLACVISFMDSPNFVNLLTRVKGCRRIISIRNYSSLENSRSRLGRLTDMAMKLLYRGADHVVTVSGLIEKDFRENYHIPAERISTIFNPFHFDEISRQGSEPLQESERIFYDSRFVFLNVGRVVYQKGGWHLLRAFRAVHEAHPQAGLVIVGEDWSEGKLTRLISEMGLEDAVLLTGRTRNPWKYMANARCYVLSSLFEGFPNALVEAMACGCPVVAADCCSGPREILCESPDLSAAIREVTQADYGLLVPALEPEENWSADGLTAGEEMLADAMERMLLDSAYASQASAQARERSRAFSYEACRLRYEKVIEG